MIEISTEVDLANIIKHDPRILIIFFSTSYCTSCNLLTPKLADLEKKYSNEILVIKIDGQKAINLFRHYFVDQIPTIVFYQNKFLFKRYRLVGANVDTIENVVNIIQSRYNKKVNDLQSVKPPNPGDIYNFNRGQVRWTS